MSKRRGIFGMETVSVFPNVDKSFRFGNGERKGASSYLQLSQLLNKSKIQLGLYTLDVPQVPILIGVKTLKRLGALIDFDKPTICFKKIAPEVFIPLCESKSGHLMIDLTKDWMPGATVFITRVTGRGSHALQQLASRYKECMPLYDHGCEDSELTGRSRTCGACRLSCF